MINKTQPYNIHELINVFVQHSIDIISAVRKENNYFTGILTYWGFRNKSRPGLRTVQLLNIRHSRPAKLQNCQNILKLSFNKLKRSEFVFKAPKRVDALRWFLSLIHTVICMIFAVLWFVHTGCGALCCVDVPRRTSTHSHRMRCVVRCVALYCNAARHCMAPDPLWLNMY